MRRFAHAVAFLALGACTVAACEEVSVRDKSKDALELLDASIDGARSSPATPVDEPFEPSCIALGAGDCAQSSDCCLGSSSGSVPYCLPSSRICGTCKAPNAFCGSGDVCCSGAPCNTATATCPDECRGAGATCDNAGQCCDKAEPSATFECRADKKCARCFPVGANCGTAADCCYGLTCSAGKCAACLPRSATGCIKDSDCCAGSVCATDPVNPAVTRCVDKCWPQWSLANVNTPCKGSTFPGDLRPCCAPFKCNFPIPSSASLGCGP